MHALFDVPAPAKLNLFLHVTGQRADGLHLLQSVFILIDWCDTLHFESRSDGRICRHDTGQTLPALDLTVKAAQLLQRATGCTQGADIHLHKRIPAQAGMGGGSSDAASTLLALNRLWRLQLSNPQLQQLGVQLGADVPFFIGGRNAWVEGIGEKITPIALEKAHFCVLKPPAGLSTAEIFSHPQLHKRTNLATMTDFAASPFDFGQNDLQTAATLLCPEVKLAIELLNAQHLKAKMTGSGSAVFAHCSPDMQRIQVPAHWMFQICSSLDAHPLVGWAGSND